MQDLLPEKQEIFRHIAHTIGDVLSAYGYREVGLPLLESTGLFERVVGEATDIVEKEMYTFDDRNGDSLTLRPEGTAGCVRFAQQHGLAFNQVQRFFYAGPMFRYERPQKGRYRQFEQIGVECFGMAGPDIDAELLMLLGRIWRELGIVGSVELELNSLGSADSRAVYRKSLVEYLSQHKAGLDADSLRRLETNPLRILDSKDPGTREILAGAPKLNEFLDEESKLHFDDLRRTLDRMQQPYRVNPSIVRGLDYYNRTVFEWTTDKLGAQGTVCGGGRYDGLFEQVGGKHTPAVGFAIGLDRLALMLEPGYEHRPEADIYVVSAGAAARTSALMLAEQVRDGFPALRVQVHCGDGKFKSQMKRADAVGARLALIIGEDEVAADTVSVKHLREEGQQVSVGSGALNDYLAKVFV
ncbi:MAG: histidine--tRNA ligase [Pseudomonadales bacterium]|nr:histidine--tRNA ligase [Pseudomonadales bacterium]